MKKKLFLRFAFYLHDPKPRKKQQNESTTCTSDLIWHRENALVNMTPVEVTERQGHSWSFLSSLAEVCQATKKDRKSVSVVEMIRGTKVFEVGRRPQGLSEDLGKLTER